MESSRPLVKGSLVLVAAAALGVGMFAQPDAVRAAPKGWMLPPGAREVAPDVFEVGTREADGISVTGYAILHYGRGRSEEAKGNAKGGRGGSGSVGYSFIANGFRWKTFGEPYVVDTDIANRDATMTAGYILQCVADGISLWEDAAADGLVGGATLDVFGDGDEGDVPLSDIGIYNEKNQVCFGPISQNGVIAVTYVWGPSYGSPGSREIWEWDQLYNDADFTWSDVNASFDTSDMDFLNIVVHEVGHAFGMGHSSLSYPEVTMYPYASEGEVKKRTLEADDATGAGRLYQ
jgi:hypothetical protein